MQTHWLCNWGLKYTFKASAVVFAVRVSKWKELPQLITALEENIARRGCLLITFTELQIGKNMIILWLISPTHFGDQPCLNVFFIIIILE